jgi:uncharacterized UBP type Zn finger protein
MANDICEDLKNAKLDTKAQADGCVECLKTGDSWVHLRRCLECGHIGCCDSSKNRHATQHYRQTQHSVIQSFEPGEGWIWCYEHEIACDPEQAA